MADGNNQAATRTYAEIQTDLLNYRATEGELAFRKQGGDLIPYIPHQTVANIGDRMAPGWESQIRTVDLGDSICIEVGIGINASDGTVWRWDAGYETKDTNSFGDPVVNAKSTAFRRAWALGHGLGRYLYDKEAREEAGIPAASVKNAGNGWDGLLWYGKTTKGKHYTDPSVDISSLEWGMKNTKYPDQAEAIRQEIAKRQGLPTPYSTNGSGGNGGGKINIRQIADLKALAEGRGMTWDKVKGMSHGEFGNADISSLSSVDFDLLKLKVEVS